MKGAVSLIVGWATCLVFSVSAGSAYAATSNDFQTVCSQPGVVKCVSFDTDADFSHGNGGTQGAYGTRSGIMPPSGTTDYSRAIRDTSVAASGASSLRFTIPSNTGADTSGTWFTNFSDDLSFQVGEGQDVYIQWRQRFSPEFLSTYYKGANGWKTAIIGAGDLPTCSLSSTGGCESACSDFETVVQNSRQIGIPQMYTNCSGPHPYWALQGYTTNVTVQNVVKCLYPDYVSPPCVKMYPNEWMTFQVHIKVGHWNQWDSTVQLWVAREGQPSVLVIDCSPTTAEPCINGDSATTGGSYLDNPDPTVKVGKIWFLPYDTNKDPTQVTPTAYTWYDNLVISKNKIPDPTAGPLPNPPTSLKAQ